MFRTRFAPSPTGPLHLGHAYAAWFAWNEASQRQGQCLLRWEDIDSTRCRPEWEAQALEDLAWLGMTFAEPMRQSARMEVYRRALQTLEDAGLLYPCFCTRKEIQVEIARAGEAPQGPDGPLYPGSCRGLAPGEASERIARGDPYALRLQMDLALRRAGPLCWEDLDRGRVACEPAIFGDVVLARKEIPTSYHLAVTIDDAAQAITLVTRGEDLLQASHLHRLLQALLGLPTPVWRHHRLITDAAGRRLAKRDHATALRALREQGWMPEDVWKALGVPCKG